MLESDSNYKSWQSSSNPELMRRLLRPITQPGIASTQLTESILLRMQAMTERLPLAEQLLQRQHWVVQRRADTVPIVYARPAGNGLGQTVSAAELQPPVWTSAQKQSPLVIQAKFAPVPQRLAKDFSRGKIDTQIQPDSRTPETSNRPLVQAKSAELQPSAQKQPPLVIQAKFAPVPQRSAKDVSRSEIDMQIQSESKAPEISKLPLVQATSAIQSVPNSVKTLPVVRENSNGSRLIARSAPTASVVQSSTGQKPIVRAKNNINLSLARLRTNSTSKTSGVVQLKLERPVVRENLRRDGRRSLLPLVLASPSTTNVPPASNGRVSSRKQNFDRYQSNGIIQRMSSLDSEFTSSQLQPNPIIERANKVGNTESNKTSNEVDVEDLIDRVQRRLMQRLTIETERRGLIRWII